MAMREGGFRVDASKRSCGIPLSGIRVVFEKAQKMTGLVRLELGEPDFPTPAHIREAAKRALDDGFTHYTSSQGLLELRKELARKLEKENGVLADPETEIIVTAGACCALGLAMLTLVNLAMKYCCRILHGRTTNPVRVLQRVLSFGIR
jgi:aspartate/methionine/tyrosine aminotransferase